jgi:NADH-quinone oxidoreductase subunit L
MDTLLANLLTLAVLVPLGASVLLALVGRKLPGNGRVSAWLAIGTVATAFVLTLISAFVYQQASSESVVGTYYTLIELGERSLRLTYAIDTLTVLLFGLVTFIATAVMVYSTEYLHEELSVHGVLDPDVRVPGHVPFIRPGRYNQFFATLSFFVASMLLLLIAGDLLTMFVGWELVGITSYLLISFYRERPLAGAAATQAVVVNRIGDTGFLIAMMALWSGVGTLTFFSDASGSPALLSWAASNEATTTLLTVASIGLVLAAIGKSAQAPLYIWLPNAMAGPTPVSALLHSATMVAAGVYLLARTLPLIPAEILLGVAYLGAITHIWGGCLALAGTDFKRVLAFSTISQLGLMFIGIGLGSRDAALFHLVTHACFKSLLFLAAGAVIHGCSTGDLRRLGGLATKMPWTAGTMLVGIVGLIGLGIPGLQFGFSGYYSKEAILSQAAAFAEANPIHGLLYYLPLFGAGLTAIYAFRLWYLVFWIRPRDEGTFAHAHPAPPRMRAVLVVLAAAAIFAAMPIPGLELSVWQSIHATAGGEPRSAEWLTGLTLPAADAHHAAEHSMVAELSALVATVVGILLITAVYIWRQLDPSELAQRFATPVRFLRREGRVEAFYNTAFVAPTLGLASGLRWFDRHAIDPVVHGLAQMWTVLARWQDVFDRRVIDSAVQGLSNRIWSWGVGLHLWQTGRLRQYVLMMTAATTAIFLIATFVWNLTRSP